jgi:hypothetical protein
MILTAIGALAFSGLVCWGLDKLEDAKNRQR